MAQIFISYSHQDTQQASKIAHELGVRGWSVWWDPEIRSGESFIVLINREISAASCVVVLWSKSSVTSHWVVEEAHNALNRDIICPVMVERDSQLPVGFATVKYIPLWEWRNDEPVGGFGPLIDELESIVGRPAPSRAAPSAPAVPAEAPVASAPSPSQQVPRESPPEPVPRRTTPERREEPAAGETPIPGLTARSIAERRRYIDFSDLSWMDLPIMGLLVAGLACLLASTIGRYLFMIASPVLYSLTPPLLALAAILGAAMAERNRRSIRSPVSMLLFRRGSGRLRTILQGIISALVFGVCTYAIGLHAARSLQVGETTYGGVPLGIVDVAATVAFALLTLFSLTAIVRPVRGGRPR
ncbi:MAG: TIR domain-containing protein [Hyphomicrobiales bacterium]|nr:TIR domain-containing protein [Hyphomicrobiales bacterium]